MARCEHHGCPHPPLPHTRRCAVHDPAVAHLEQRWIERHGTYHERYPPASLAAADPVDRAASQFRRTPPLAPMGHPSSKG